MQCNLQGRVILQWTRLSELSLVNLKIYTVKIDLYVNVDQFTLHFFTTQFVTCEIDNDDGKTTTLYA